MSGLGLTFLRRGNLAHPTAGSDYILSESRGDAEVFRILMSKGVSSDGVGITKDDAARVTSISTWFLKNTTITSFEELQYFINVKSLVGQAFSDCSALQKVGLQNIVTMANNVFINCTNLQYFDAPNLETITGSTTLRYSGIEYINAPKLVSANDYSFANCTNLKSANLQSMEKVPTYCFVASGIEEITLPSCTIINTHAFLQCNSLKKVVLPLIENIGNNAFQNTPAMEYIELGENCTSIGSYVFWQMTTSKVTFICRATIPPTLKANNNLNFCKDIFVPDASVDAYQAADMWSTYSAMIKPLSQYNG